VQAFHQARHDWRQSNGQAVRNLSGDWVQRRQQALESVAELLAEPRADWP
jgi:nicotinamide riboside kinase